MKSDLKEGDEVERFLAVSVEYLGIGQRRSIARLGPMFFGPPTEPVISSRTGLRYEELDQIYSWALVAGRR